MLLNEFNYLPLLRVVTIILGGRFTLSFINGSTIPPEVNDVEYEAWLSKRQPVMSWILNSMEHNIAEIFSFSESLLDLWDAIRMEIKIILSGFSRFIARLPIFIKMESLKILWNELEMYCLYTIVAAILQKRTEDRIFQLLAGLSPDFENLQSHILMNLELPSLK